MNFGQRFDINIKGNLKLTCESKYKPLSIFMWGLSLRGLKQITNTCFLLTQSGRNKIRDSYKIRILLY